MREDIFYLNRPKYRIVLLVVALLNIFFNSCGPHEKKTPDHLSNSDLALLHKSYHSNEALFRMVKKSTCPLEATFQVRSLRNGSGAHIDVAFLKRNNALNRAKIFVVANQHARELISGEVAASFVVKMCAAWTACGLGVCNKEQRSTFDATKNTDFVVVFNANPKGRQAVMNGSAASTRVNPLTGIDLNRNWDVAFVPEPKNPEKAHLFGGDFAFQDPNVALMRDLFNQENPDLFLDLHSGTLALLTNFAFEKSVDNKVYATQKKLLNRIQQRFCPNCLVGSIAEKLDYLSNGTATDWARVKKHLSLSFLFEIYGGDKNKEPSPTEFENYWLRWFNPPPAEYKTVVNKWVQVLNIVAGFIHEVPKSERFVTYGSKAPYSQKSKELLSRQEN